MCAVMLSAMAMLEKARVASRIGTESSAPSGVRGKLKEGDEGVDGMGVGRFVKTTQVERKWDDGAEVLTDEVFEQACVE